MGAGVGNAQISQHPSLIEEKTLFFLYILGSISPENACMLDPVLGSGKGTGGKTLLGGAREKLTKCKSV